MPTAHGGRGLAGRCGQHADRHSKRSSLARPAHLPWLGPSFFTSLSSAGSPHLQLGTGGPWDMAAGAAVAGGRQAAAAVPAADSPPGRWRGLGAPAPGAAAGPGRLSPCASPRRRPRQPESLSVFFSEWQTGWSACKAWRAAQLTGQVPMRRASVCWRPSQGFWQAAGGGGAACPAGSPRERCVSPHSTT